MDLSGRPYTDFFFTIPNINETSQFGNLNIRIPTRRAWLLTPFQYIKLNCVLFVHWIHKERINSIKCQKFKKKTFLTNHIKKRAILVCPFFLFINLETSDLKLSFATWKWGGAPCWWVDLLKCQDYRSEKR